MVYHSITGPRYAGQATGTFEDLRLAVTRAIRAIEPNLKRFDVIAVQGTSGMSIGFPVALALDVPIVVVRKPDEQSHGKPGEVVGAGDSYSPRPEILDGRRVLFVDDFVSMGETRARVRKAIEFRGAKVVAEYMSREDSYIAC